MKNFHLSDKPRMKKIYGFLSVALLALMGGACNSSNSDDGMVDYLAVQVEQDGKWGFIDPDGKVKYPDEFKNPPSCVVNGYFSVEEGNGYTLYKAGDQPEAVKNATDLKAVGYMNEGLVPVVRDKARITIIDGNGTDKFTLEPVNGKEIVWCSLAYSDGMLMIKTDDDKSGYINTKGETVIKPEYTEAWDFNEGLAVVEKDDKTFVINKKGETVIKIKKDWIPSTTFNYGVLVVRDNNDHVLFMDKKGETTKCPAKVKDIADYNSDYYVFTDGANCGVMSRKDDKIIVRAKYASIQIMEGNRFLCSDAKKHVILNSKGDVEKDLDEYEYADNCGKFGILATEKNSYVLLNEKGEFKKGCEYYGINPGSSACPSVLSDYFSIDAMANNVTERFTTSGFGKINIGMKPSAFLSNPSNYLNKSRISPDSLRGNG